jgi:hypothetical protein
VDTMVHYCYGIVTKNGEDINRWYAELILTIQLTELKKVKTKDLDAFYW